MEKDGQTQPDCIGYDSAKGAQYYSQFRAYRDSVSFF